MSELGTTEALDALFPFSAADKGGLRWAHAVNSCAQLTSCLSDPSLHLLEADVMLDESTGTPYMSHPPELCREESLADFLAAVVAASRPLAVKLDFKSPSALTAALPLLRQTIQLPSWPGLVWLNADVLGGGETAKDAYAAALKKSRVQLPSAHYSLGWKLEVPLEELLASWRRRRFCV